MADNRSGDRVDNKHKTKAELLDELESIKDLLLDELGDEELPSLEDVPLLNDVVEGPATDAGSDTDTPPFVDDLAEIRLAYQQVIPEAALPDTPETPLSEQQISEDAIEVPDAGYHQPPGLPDKDETIESDMTTLEDQAIPEERVETQQSLFESCEIPALYDEGQVTATEAPATPSDDQTPDPEHSPEAEEETHRPGENPFLPKHIRDKQRGLNFDQEAQPGQSPPDPTSRSELESVAHKVLEEVIRDFTPIIEAELHSRLGRLMEQQLNELDPGGDDDPLS